MEHRPWLRSPPGGALNLIPCTAGLRARNRARTVASMKASSNNRWRGP